VFYIIYKKKGNFIRKPNEATLFVLEVVDSNEINMLKTVKKNKSGRSFCGYKNLKKYISRLLF